MKKVNVKRCVTTMVFFMIVLSTLVFPNNVKAVNINESEIQPLWYDPSGNWPGSIFLTLDNGSGSGSSSWNYGHAGIGGNNGETNEAFPDTNVAIFADGYETNWQYCSTGGIYNVSGATTSQYQTAMNYAYAQVGKKYSLNLLDGTSAFYCSELVYNAWKQAGFTVGSNILGVITPESIMNDSDTYCVYSF